MVKISAVLITRNEEVHIAAALDSVAWADERVVVDAESRDRTAAIARANGARVITRAWPGYVDQKNFAAGLAEHDWIFSLDADERVTPALAAEVRTRLAREPIERAFRMPRVAFYLGRWIRSTDWHPDYQLRLYDRRAAKWTGRYVHESVEVMGPIGRLTGELQHYAYRDVSHHLATIDRYSTLAARQLREAGRSAGALDLAVRPPLAFLRNYILRLGVRDGAAGLAVSVLNSYYVFLKFAKLWELANAPDADRDQRRPETGTPAGRRDAAD